MSIAARAIAAIRQEPTVPISYPAGGAWHAFRTNIKCEFRAKYGIEALGYKTFIPMEKRLIIRQRRKVTVETPLFSRYGFVHLDINKDEWAAILDVDGVESLLCNNQLPVRVPVMEIEKLKLAEEFGLFDRTKKPDPFKPGDQVKIDEGPFAGFLGKVLRARTGDRVDILLSFFGSTREMSFPLLHLRENRV